MLFRSVKYSWAYLMPFGNSLVIGNLLCTTNNPQWAVIENTETTGGIGNGSLTVTQTTNAVYQGYIRNNAGGSGTLSMVKNGPATLTFAGANISYTGSTTVNEGTLVISNAAAFASASYVTGINGVLEFQVNNAVTADNGATKITGNGILRKKGLGQLMWGATAAEFAMSGGRIEVNEGSMIGGSSANEVWTSNKASLYVAAGATFAGVEASVVVDAWEGAEIGRAHV